MTEILRIDLNGVNCYLAKNESSFVLFDAGGHLVTDKVFSNRLELLQKELESAGCTESNLKLIVLTHGDNDHTHNAAYLRNRYNTKVAIHSDDRELVESPSLAKWMESFRYRSLVYKTVLRLLNKTITKVTQKALEDFEPFTPDIFLSDGFDLSAYGLKAITIHLPGHTKGSVGILTQTGDLIAGDTFANTNKPASAANAQDFKVLSESISKLKNYKIRTVYPGHGSPFAFEEFKM